MASNSWGGPGEDYRLKKINTTGTYASTPVAPPEPDRVAPVWSVPPAIRTLPWFEITMIVLSLAGAAFLGWTYIQADGVQATISMTLLAMIPLMIVIAVMTRIDRWEPEPVWSKIVAFMWGAGVATLTASIINTALMTNVTLVTGDQYMAQILTAVGVAPVAEEFFKGMGVVILILARRTSINSLLDGAVYAGFVAAGFAFVENIQYFLQANAMGASSLTLTVFMRGILSPFVHPMATSLTGLGLAWALVRARTLASRLVVIPLSWCAGVFIHALWNFLGSATDSLSWLQMYVVIEIPLFAAWLMALMVMASRERKTIASGLIPYVRTGWVLPAEVAMVTEAGRRKAAKVWARTGGQDSLKAMKSFMAKLASLGLDQELQARLGPMPDRIAQDRRWLEQASHHREEFLRLTSIASAQRAVSTSVNQRKSV